MAFGDVLVHVATPVVRRRSGAAEDVWVEGQRISGDWVEGSLPSGDVAGTPFDCCLFLPMGTEQPTGRGRQVTEPTLLFEPFDQSGAPFGLTAEHYLLIVAPELNAAEGLAADTAVRYTVQGRPQPFGRPGADVVGLQASLRRVDD